MFKTLLGHCVAFFGHALYSHSAFLHPGEEELLNCHENLKKCWGKVGNNLLQTGFLCNIPIISKNIGQFLELHSLSCCCDFYPPSKCILLDLLHCSSKEIQQQPPFGATIQGGGGKWVSPAIKLISVPWK